MLIKFKYADLLDDNVFKLVFGQESSKDVMIEFLNQVIPDRSIVDLEFMDKEMHPVELMTDQGLLLRYRGESNRFIRSAPSIIPRSRFRSR